MFFACCLERSHRRPSSLSISAPLCRPLSSPRLVFLPSVHVHCSLPVMFIVLCPLTGSFPSCLSTDFPTVRNAHRPLSPLPSVRCLCAVHCPLPPLRLVSPLFCWCTLLTAHNVCRPLSSPGLVAILSVNVLAHCAQCHCWWHAVRCPLAPCFDMHCKHVLKASTSP